MSEYRFTLYIAGESPRSQRAEANLRHICVKLLQGEGCDFKVIDVTRDPEAAETHRILTTPTVVRETPEPLRRVTGDLSDARRVLAGLAPDFQASPEPVA